MQVNDPKGEAGKKKAPMNLLPPYAMEQTAWVHKLGEAKYGSYNWRKTGVCASTYVSAIMRHLNAWRDGEDLDPESGISHIAHVATSCNILLDAEHCGTLQDDRNKVPVAETPEGLPPYPIAPIGYSHWVDRGRGWTSPEKVKLVLFDTKSHLDGWSYVLTGWTIGHPDVHYLEAVKN